MATEMQFKTIENRINRENNYRTVESVESVECSQLPEYKDPNQTNVFSHKRPVY